ncbi:MAG: acetoacetate--CoA ligase [Bacteroidetes bacterium]|nr:MAG: acetoacetate--CoA ligase [Bacteroidota bacterium]
MANKILWKPDENVKSHSAMNHYAAWLAKEKNLHFADYDEMWQWSVSKPEDFWESISQYFKITHHAPYQNVMSNDPMPNTKWFEGSELNYAEHIFKNKFSSHPAIYFYSESKELQYITWIELEQKVAAVQTYFLQLGLKPGDRVAAYLPNIPEASIAWLAAISIGCIWTSCSPDFGTESVVDRFKQVEPRLFIAVDGYQYNGKKFDRSEVVKSILAELPTVEITVLVPYLNETFASGRLANSIEWKQILNQAHGEIQFLLLPFSHPIWILFSSGTTGIPKAITHSHGGVLLEHYKYLSLHNDVKPGENFFWFTTTGWMMWNFTQAALLVGATIVLYDGSPAYPDLGRLWKLANDIPIHHFGTSAPFIVACMKAGIVPAKEFNLESLRSIGSTGSPLPSEGFDYVYESIKSNVWLCSMSGGTDVATAFVGSCPWLPVYEGEIQCRALGCDLHALDEMGNEVFGEVGEMVIKTPMPSMPVFFWNDPDQQKYLSSYFEMYPGIWRHGDWIKILKEGLIILGRSDATLNRQGVRIGTAEIYRAVDQIPEIKDSLIVNIELPNGSDYMPLFVVLNGGSLTDEIKGRIRDVLRKNYSPRHVPDEIIAVHDIPYTISGKKMETPVKKILMGKPIEKSLNIGSVKNPDSLKFFESFKMPGDK